MKSDVFYTNLRTGFNNSLLDKLNRLMTKAGISNIDFEDKYVAIKMHFGEPGNLEFLRPNWAKCVADKVKELGGKPFLTDCNTRYVGGRKNALDHMLTAEQNGFNYVSTGCQIIIGDGLKGSDDIEIPVEGGKYIETAKIGRAIMDADIFISLSHFKGHEGTGFGGALKNIGMGCGSRRGKMEMHVSGKPNVDKDECIGCGMCTKICAHGAHLLKDKKCTIDHEKCVGCGACTKVCPNGVIKLVPYSAEYLVACNNHEAGVKAKKNCLKACIGCKMCVLKVENSPFTVDKFLSVNDYSKDQSACPLAA